MTITTTELQAVAHAVVRRAERQGFVLEHAFRQIALMFFNPVPVLSAGDPIPATRRTLPRSKIRVQLRR